MGYKTAPHRSLGLPCGFHQFMPLTEGTPLLFESQWVLYPAFGSPPAPTPPPPTHPPPIESIRDITGTEKTVWKTSRIQIASRVTVPLNYNFILARVDTRGTTTKLYWIPLRVSVGHVSFMLCHACLLHECHACNGPSCSLHDHAWNTHTRFLYQIVNGTLAYCDFLLLQSLNDRWYRKSARMQRNNSFATLNG